MFIASHHYGSELEMSKEFRHNNMWDSSYRPEQMFACDFLSKIMPEVEIKLEYKVKNLTIDGDPTKPCTLDIAIPEKMMAIRMNGGYHFSSGRQRTKDEFQKEALIQAGWRVIDFDYHLMPNLFKKSKNIETVKLSEEEILRYMGNYK